jgi:putative transposase
MTENNKQSVEYDPGMHHRRSIRFRGFDYSRTGDYFLTIVAHNRRCLFGEIVDGRVELSPVGQIVLSEWRKTPAVRSEIELDECVIMPNHIHGIIRISGGAGCIRPINNGHTPCAPTPNSVVGADGIRPHSYAPSSDAVVGMDGIRPHTCAPSPDAVVGADGVRPHNNNGAHPNPHRQPRTLGAFVAGFKAAVTRAIRQQLHLQNKPIWQRNYFEHIIRNWKDLNRVRDYIRSNPTRWDDDEENPANSVVGADGIRPKIRRFEIL